MERERTYVCIDLKSFYASVECVRRGLDPMTTRLVVADPTRSEMTICLAVSPAMKAAGVKNRCRLYEIPEGIDYVTARPRGRQLHGGVGGDLRHLPALCVPGGHPSLFHRRVLHRRHALPGAVRPDGPRVRRHAALGGARGDRASRPPWASAPACPSRRWRSTSRPSTRRTGWASSMRAPFARASGGIGPSPTFGTSGRALLGGSRSTGCSI